MLRSAAGRAQIPREARETSAARQLPKTGGTMPAGGIQEFPDTVLGAGGAGRKLTKPCTPQGTFLTAVNSPGRRRQLFYAFEPV